MFYCSFDTVVIEVSDIYQLLKQMIIHQFENQRILAIMTNEVPAKPWWMGAVHRRRSPGCDIWYKVEGRPAPISTKALHSTRSTTALQSAAAPHKIGQSNRHTHNQVAAKE